MICSLFNKQDLKPDLSSGYSHRIRTRCRNSESRAGRHTKFASTLEYNRYIYCNNSVILIHVEAQHEPIETVCISGFYN